MMATIVNAPKISEYFDLSITSDFAKEFMEDYLKTAKF